MKPSRQWAVFYFYTYLINNSLSAGQFILSTFCFLFFTECKTSHRTYLSVNELEQARKEFDLPKDKTYKLDTSYLRFLFTLDTAKYADQIKNHYQPIQALYYDRSGQLLSFHINCYAGIGVSDDDDLNWNQKNAFASFIPNSVAPVDSILPLCKHLEFIENFDNSPIDTTGFSAFDYTVIIHWNKKWRAQDSKNLIRIVSENIKLDTAKKVNLLYINSDDVL